MPSKLSHTRPAATDVLLAPCCWPQVCGVRCIKAAGGAGAHAQAGPGSWGRQRAAPTYDCLRQQVSERGHVSVHQHVSIVGRLKDRQDILGRLGCINRQPDNG